MKAPSPPDPQQTAQTQQSLNNSTAVTQYLLNATNQVTPTGSLTYNQTGQNFVPSDTGSTYYYDPATGQYHSSLPTKDVTSSGGGHWVTSGSAGHNGPGQTRTWVPDSSTSQQSYTPDGWQTVKGSLVPQMTATQTLTPDQQQILDNQEEMEKRLTALGITQSDRLSQLLSQPFSLDNDAVESRLMQLGKERLDPQLAQRRQSTEQDLYNRGVRSGSDAYNQSMNTLNQGENDAYNQLLLTGRQEAVQEALTQRNQPINEILALAGASQVQQPNFVSTPGTQVSGVDYTGLVNQQYNAQQQAYQSGMSGLFGLGSAAIGGWAMSDERLKTDKEKVGETDDGIGIYKYRFK